MISLRAIKIIVIQFSFFLCLFTPYSKAAQPLPIDQAFQLSTALDANNVITATWKIAPGYYLYKDKFTFTTLNPAAVQLGKPLFPAGVLHEDSILGKYEIYLNQVSLQVPITGAGNAFTTVAIRYQGCSSEGFCYPPTTKEVSFNVVNSNTSAVTTTDQVNRLVTSHNFFLITLGFFILGIFLAFTPCVFPMLPILSSIIVGQKQPLSTARAFHLSLTYVLSMAVTYALAGLLLGYAGSNLQTALQNPWIISSFSMLLVVLACSMFGFYELQLPAALRDRLQNINQRQAGGNYFSVAIMGFISTLIVSPCVSAPLVGALSYISQQGNPWLGASTLLALGLGMGVPLLLVGTFGGSLLPKAGSWMNTIKNSFGIALLALALWMLERFVPPTLTIWVWALLFIMSSIALGALEPAPAGGQKLWKGACFIMLLYGLLIAFTAVQGNTNPWKVGLVSPELAQLSNNSVAFKTVTTLTAVRQVLAEAQQQHKKVLLDFYADWCVSCKQMDKRVFSDPRIKTALANVVLLRADITANSAASKLLKQAYAVIAPPTILFLNEQGTEQKERRIIGEIDSEFFLKQLN